MLDFPSSPTNGQKYPTPAVAGVPQYTWDGEKWTTVGGSIVSATPATATPLMDATPAVVGTTTKFAREDHVHPVDTSRAPFDALAYSGLQINGGMEVSQQNGATAITVTGAALYPIDNWMAVSIGAQSLGAGQVTTAPAGYANSLSLVVPVANTSPAAGDYALAVHRIEGYRCSRLAWGTPVAQPITIGFWVDVNRPGIYSGCVQNGSGTRSYPFTFTVNSATAWEYKTITVPGDVTGTWAKNSTVGMQIYIGLMVGTTYQAAPGAWAAGNFFGATGTINAVAATTDFMLLAGFTVHPGNEAPSAARAPFVMRPYDQEIVTCQRYFRWLPFAMQFQAYGPSEQMSTCTYFPNMRAAPTIATITADPNQTPAAANNAANGFNTITPYSALCYLVATAAGSCVVVGYRSAADARL